MMKKKFVSALLCLAMVLSSVVLCFTGCSNASAEEVIDSLKTTASTLVMWCVTEDGTDDAQAAAVAQAMSEITQSKYKIKLIVKYMTMDEYYTNLEAAYAETERIIEEKEAADKKAKEDGKDPDKEKEEEEEEAKKKAEEEENKNKDEIRYDENGNIIIDTTVYPEVEDHQVDILYISGYDKYEEYIKSEWLSPLKSELNGGSKKISNFVSTALLSAVQYEGETYAIPNNNVIGEYTYMLVNKALYDKYYYSGYIDTVKSIVDLSSFLEDIAMYEPDVLPINGDVDYCMSLIASYWSIDPNTLAINPDVFSVLGYAYTGTDKRNRGDVALKFENLLNNDTYVKALNNLMKYKFDNYFGTPAEGQVSAVTFTKGDASVAEQYTDDYYVVPVDYPKAVTEDIYGNMFAVSKYTSDVTKSMQVITLLNTDADFRNLFQYGIEGTNYTLNDDGTVSTTRTNAYHMDITKTGNEFIAYVPEGTNLKIWEYAKQQNRESLVNPLMGFSFQKMLDLANKEYEEAFEKSKEKDTWIDLVTEKIDTDLIKYLNELSAKTWTKIQACTSEEELEETIKTLKTSMTASKDANIKKAIAYTVVVPEFDPKDGQIMVDEDGKPKVPGVNVGSATEIVQYTITLDKDGNLVLPKKEEDPAEGETQPAEDTQPDDGTEEEPVDESEWKVIPKQYLHITYTLTPYQLYYRWMKTFSFLPASFETPAM